MLKTHCRGYPFLLLAMEDRPTDNRENCPFKSEVALKEKKKRQSISKKKKKLVKPTPNAPESTTVSGWRTTGRSRRRERMMQGGMGLATRMPYRIHHSVLHLPRPRSHSQVKNFLLRKQNKTKNHSRKGVEGRRILENIKPLTSGGSQRAHAEAGPSKSSSWCCRLSSSPRSVWGEGKETGWEASTEGRMFQSTGMSAWTRCQHRAGNLFLSTQEAFTGTSLTSGLHCRQQASALELISSSHLFYNFEYKNRKHSDPEFLFHFCLHLKDSFWFGLITALAVLRHTYW